MKKICFAVAFVFLLNISAIAQVKLSNELAGKFKIVAEGKKISFDSPSLPATVANNLMDEAEKLFWFGKTAYNFGNKRNAEARPVAKIQLEKGLVALFVIESEKHRVKQGLNAVLQMKIYDANGELYTQELIELFDGGDIQTALTLEMVYAQIKDIKVTFTNEAPLTFEVKKANGTKKYELNSRNFFKEVKK